MNRFGTHVMGLSKFADALLPVILHFGSKIGDGSLAVRFLLTAGAISFTSPFDKRSYLHSCQGLVMIDCLNDFLNPLKLFVAVESDFTKSL